MGLATAHAPLSVLAQAMSAAPVPEGGLKITFAPNVTPSSFESTVSTGSAAATAGGSDVAFDASSQASSSRPKHLFPPTTSVSREPTTVQRVPHTKKRDQNHIPRPPNSFILFRSEFIKNQHVPGTIESNHGSLSKIIGLCWRNLSFEERAIWDEKAKVALEEHKAKYPTYKYRPAPPRREDSTTAKPTTPSKRAAAGGKITQIVSPAALHARSERKAEDVAKLLLEGKRGDELEGAFKELEREREVQAPYPASPTPAFAHNGVLGFYPHLQHRRSSSAPPTEHAFSFNPGHRNSIVFAHADFSTAGPRASLAVRSLALEHPMGTFGASPANMMDTSSPPSLMTLDTSGAPSSIAADLFGAFTQNPFATDASLPQQPPSELDFAAQSPPADSGFDMFLAAGGFPSPVEGQYPGPMDPRAGVDYTFDLSAFPSDTVQSSNDLATWASLPAQPSPPAQMPDLIPPEAQIPYPMEFWPQAQQMADQFAAYAQQQQQQQYYAPNAVPYDAGSTSDTEPFSPTTPYDGSAPVTPIQHIMEPEEKAFYKLIKDGLELASPTPTSAYGMPSFLSSNTAVY
ncbi:hypothetical protein EXIGLDRAFT_701732 [Exidia glandulosa HHB12029]|uniref:HMG box domain-containing protein n=1 Tax=Exidia glandulosa HHB12029 TaxID=1314781 RepID=A0A165LRN5_EXIGL|nr:hypothetical protein EXIGLDRAFT_701732 [Exidia glandulosa HHB12029]